MGTHPSCPSSLRANSSDDAQTPTLASLIASDPKSFLGEKVVNRFGSKDLPFLFKVLAIGKALSIQAHPDKELAERLHGENPDVYKGQFSRRQSG